MQFQFDIASQNPAPQVHPQSTDTNTDLLRQILEVQRDGLAQIVQAQRELLSHARALAMDNVGRWRNLLTRWNKSMPELTDYCKQAYPILERAYVHMISGLVEELSDQGDDALENDFAVQDFLDRFGMRITQMGQMLNVVGALAEAAHQNDAAAASEEKSA